MIWRQRALALVGVRVNESAGWDPDAVYLAGYHSGYSKGRQAEAVDWHAALSDGGDVADWPDAARWTPHRPEWPPPADSLPGDGQQVVLTGELVDVVRHVNSTGAPWAEAGLELLGSGEVVEIRLYPQTYSQVVDLIWEGEKVTLSGRVDRREDVVVVIVADAVRGGA